MTNQAPVITIDGPSGAGKSALCKVIANKLNWYSLESGKIYRLLAVLVLNNKIDILEENIIPLIENLDFLSNKQKTTIKNTNVFSSQKNFHAISDISSKLAIYPKIRKILLNKQRLMRNFPGLVAEGRDMGATVFPDAIIKIFLHAKLRTRVKRRMLELQNLGYNISFNKLFQEMKDRDERDKNRLISPLCISKNAVILDSTYMTFSEVIEMSMKIIVKKINFTF